MSFTGDSRENEISSCLIQNTCGGILMNGTLFSYQRQCIKYIQIKVVAINDNSL
jgi:hypothetical protein